MLLRSNFSRQHSVSSCKQIKKNIEVVLVEAHRRASTIIHVRKRFIVVKDKRVFDEQRGVVSVISMCYNHHYRKGNIILEQRICIDKQDGNDGASMAQVYVVESLGLLKPDTSCAQKITPEPLAEDYCRTSRYLPVTTKAHFLVACLSLGRR